MYFKFRKGTRGALVCCLLIHFLCSQTLPTNAGEIKRFALSDFDPRAFFSRSTAASLPAGEKAAETSPGSWFGSWFGAKSNTDTTPNPDTTTEAESPEVTEERCKAPLKHFLKLLAEKIASTVVSFEPNVTDEMKKTQIEMAGKVTDEMIDKALQEGNIVGVTSFVVGAEFRTVPVVGERLAGFAESIAEKATTRVLDDLCTSHHCCFH